MNERGANARRHAPLRHLDSDSCQSQGEGGVVAVVRGLRDARLSITLTDVRDLERAGVNRNAVECCHLASACSSTQTKAREATRRATLKAHPILDGYISSYQSAYGIAHTSSGTPLKQEYLVYRSDSLPVHRFPPQGSTYDSHPVRDSSAMQTSSWTDSRVMSLTDPFISSLRRYTQESPDKSISLDIMQRYVQHSAGNTQLHTGNQRVTRNLRCLRQSQEVSEEETKESKNIQTYTRDKSPVGVEKRGSEDEERKRRDSPAKEEPGCSSHTDGLFYDYLHPQSHHIVRVETPGQETPAQGETPGSVTRPEKRLPQATEKPSRAESPPRTFPARVKTTPETSPMRTKTSRNNSPVRTKTSTSHHVAVRMSPETSPVRTKTSTSHHIAVRMSPDSSPVRTKTSTSHHIAVRMSPETSPVRMSPQTSPMRTKTSATKQLLRTKTHTPSLIRTETSTCRKEETSRNVPTDVNVNMSSQSSRLRKKTSSVSSGRARVNFSSLRTDAHRFALMHADALRCCPLENSVRAAFASKAEVRYLSDITKHVTDVLKQIYADTPPVDCPHMNRRYQQHRRLYHGSNASTTPEYQSHQTRSPMRMHQSRSRHSLSTSEATHSMSHKISRCRQTCSFCQKPSPCGCTRHKKLSGLFNTIGTICNTPADENYKVRDREYINRKIEVTVYDWLAEVPVYASYTSSDRCKRERIFMDFIGYIQQQYGHDNFEQAVREMALRCLSELPMWYPNKGDKTEIRMQYTDKLIRQLKKVMSKRDKFGEAVGQWFEQLCFEETHDGKPVDRFYFLKEFTKELRKTACRNSDSEEEYLSLLEEKAFSLIEKLPLIVEGCRMRANQMYTCDLINILADIPSKDVKKQLEYEPETVLELEALEYIEDLPEFSELSESEKREALKKFAKMLEQLKDQGLSEKEIHERMDAAINDWAKHLQTTQPVEVEREIGKDIMEWIKSIPELVPRNPQDLVNNESFATKLAEKLNILQKEGIENDVVQDQILAEIKDALTVELEKRGIGMDLKTKQRLAENLLEKLEKRLTQAKQLRQLPNLFRKKIKTWFSNMPELTEGTLAEKKELEQIIQTHSNDLYNLQKNGINENIQNLMLGNIKNMYSTVLTKRGIASTELQSNKACEILLDEILKIIQNVGVDHLSLQELENLIPKQILDTIESVPQLTSASDAEKKETEEIVKMAAKPIVEMVIEGIEDEHVQNAMVDEMKSLVDQVVEIKQASIDDNAKNDIAEKIVDDVVISIDTIKNVNRLPKLYQKIIESWLDDINELSDTAGDKEENKKISQYLAERLIPLQAKHIDETVKDKMRDEIHNGLQHTLDKRGKHLNPRSADTYIENLLIQLVRASNYVPKGYTATKQIQDEFENEVIDWLEDIAQLTNCASEDKASIRQLCNNLARELKEVYHEGLLNDEMKSKMLKVIMSYLNIIMEIRGQHALDPRDKEELAEQLLDKIIVKSEVIAKERNLTSTLKKRIFKWMQNIPELADSSTTGIKNNNEMALVLAKKLIELESKTVDDEEFRKLAISLINNSLEAWLLLKCEHIDVKLNHKLVENLCDKITMIVGQEIYEIPNTKIQKEIQTDIEEWLEDIPELVLETVEDIEEAKKMVKRLTKNILSLYSEGIDDEQIQQQMIDNIEDELDTFLVKRGKKLDMIQNLEQAERLYDKIVSNADIITKQLNMPYAILRDVMNWIENIPELASTDSSTKTDNKQWGRCLSEKLLKLQEKVSDTKKQRKQMVRLLKSELELFLQKKGQQISENAKTELVEKLINKLTKRMQAADISSVPTKVIYRNYRDDIEVWLYNIPQIPAGKIREELVQKLATELNNIQALGIQDKMIQRRMFDRIKIHLDDTLSHLKIDMPEEEKHRLTEDLLATLTLTGDFVGKKQKLPGNIKKHISHWIEDTPELTSHTPSEKKDNYEITRILAKKVHRMQAMGLDSDIFREQIMKEISEVLSSSLERKGERMSPNAKNKVARELFRSLSELIDKTNNVQVPVGLLRKTFQQEISEWIKNIPELDGTSENNEVMSDLSQKLAHMYTAGLDNDKDDVKEEIKTAIEMALKHESMSESLRTKLTEKLMWNIASTAGREKFNVEEKNVLDKLKRDIKNWIEDIDELNSVKNDVKQNLFVKITEIIHDFISQDIDDDSVQENQIQQIKEALQYGLGKKKMDEETKHILSERLLYQATETDRKYGEKYKISNAFYKIILQWFENIPETAANSDSEHERLETVSKALAVRVKDLLEKGKYNEETRCKILAEIKENLNYILEISQNQINGEQTAKLCEELLNKLLKCNHKIKSKMMIDKQKKKQEFKEPIGKSEATERGNRLATVPKDELKNINTNWESELNSKQKRHKQKEKQGFEESESELLSEGSSSETMKNVITTDTEKELEATSARKGDKLNSKRKSQKTESLLNDTTKFAKNLNKQREKQEFEEPIGKSKATERGNRLATVAKDEFKNINTNWESELNSKQKRHKQKEKQEFEQSESELLSEGSSSETMKNVITTDIEKELEATSARKGDKLNSKRKSQETESLLNDTTKFAKNLNKQREKKEFEEPMGKSKATERGNRLATVAKDEFKNINTNWESELNSKQKRHKQKEKQEFEESESELLSEGSSSETMRNVITTDIEKELEATSARKDDKLNSKRKSQKTESLLNDKTKFAKNLNKQKEKQEFEEPIGKSEATERGNRLATVAKDELKNLNTNWESELNSKQKRHKQKEKQEFEESESELLSEGSSSETMKNVITTDIEKELEATSARKGDKLNSKRKSQKTESLLNDTTKFAKNPSKQKEKQGFEEPIGKSEATVRGNRLATVAKDELKNLNTNWESELNSKQKRHKQKEKQEFEESESELLSEGSSRETMKNVITTDIEKELEATSARKGDKLNSKRKSQSLLNDTTKFAKNLNKQKEKQEFEEPIGKSKATERGNRLATVGKDKLKNINTDWESNDPDVIRKLLTELLENIKKLLAKGASYETIKNLMITDRGQQLEEMDEIEFNLEPEEDETSEYKLFTHEEVMSWLNGVPGFGLTQPQINRIVENWYKRIREFRELSCSCGAEKNNLTNALARKIHCILSSETNIVTRKRQLRLIIGDWLVNVSSKLCVQLSCSVKDKYVTKLMTDIDEEKETSQCMSNCSSREMFRCPSLINTEICNMPEYKKPHCLKKFSDSCCCTQRASLVMKQQNQMQGPYAIYNMEKIMNRNAKFGKNYSENDDSLEVLSKELDEGTQKKITAAITNNLSKLNTQDVDDIRNELIHILKEADVNDEEALVLSNKIIEAARANYENKRRADWTPMEKDAFTEKATAEMSIFINGITGDVSPENKRKVEETKTRAVSKIADIMANPNLSKAKKQDLVREEILKNLQALPIDSDEPLEELANVHTRTIMNIADGAKNSTPRGSRDESWNKQSEQEYLNQVAEAIDRWAETVPETETGPDAKGFRETLTQDLARDIVDRQKYLQLHPEARKCKDDELDNLKYQTYRYLNKILESKNLNKAISKVPTLMDALNRIKVPQMVTQWKQGSYRNKLDIVRLIDENLNAALDDWLKKTPLYQKKNPQDRLEQETMVSELAEALKNIVENNDATDEAIEEQLIDETVRRLQDIVMGTDLMYDEDYLFKVALQIFDFVRKQQRSYKGCCSSPPPDLVLDTVVDDWMEGLQICNWDGKGKSNCEKINFVSKLRSLRQIHDVRSCQHEPALKSAINRFLRSVVDPCKRTNECYLSHKTNELLRHLRTVPVDFDESYTTYVPKPFKKPTDALFEDIDKWCNDLPIHSGDSPEDQDMDGVLKRNLTCRLVNKIGELNMNPEILNDEFLYEDLLTDEIDKILEDLPMNSELDKYLNILKKELICKVKEGRQRILDDLLGKAYKQQLRETISTSIHISECLSPEEEASFEILKDNLADAYINLYYVIDNDEDRIKFKKKILDEINKFSQEMLHRLPCDVDASRINKDLYNALRKIPMPRDESMKNEVEKSRVKSVIDDWLKDLHLKQESATTLLHRNKMAIILAKRIQEIEREKDVDPEMDSDPKIFDEATKFLRKLSLGVRETKIEEWAEMLKCRLKCTEKSRVFNIHQQRSSETQANNVCFGSSGTQSRLTAEDRAHLKTIRDRNRRSNCNSTCSLLQDACSQTSMPTITGPSPQFSRSVSCQTMRNYSRPVPVNLTRSNTNRSLIKTRCVNVTKGCCKSIATDHASTERYDTEPQSCCTYHENDISAEQLDERSHRAVSAIRFDSIESDDDFPAVRNTKTCTKCVSGKAMVDGWANRDNADDSDCYSSGVKLDRFPQRGIRHKKAQCHCKDRVLMVCKGCKSNKNQVKLYKDACSNCGPRCPNPNLYFK